MRFQSLRLAQISTIWDLYIRKRSRDRFGTKLVDSFRKNFGKHWSRTMKNKAGGEDYSIPASARSTE